MNRAEIGKQKEQLAVKFLENIGYTILSRNFRTKFGEIDIVAKDGNTIVFVEVRSKKYTVFGAPEESISKSKQTKVIKTAYEFLAACTQFYDAVRFDVVAIVGDEVHHIQNAFSVDYVI